jgi:ATP-binding cassette, subfamily B, bacterial
MARRGQNDPEADERPSSKNLTAIRGLLPFVLKYKSRLALVVFMLTLAAGVTLAMPYGVRLLIDNGFSDELGTGVDKYFGFFLALASLLALSSAGRFYFVMWMGERVVADVRKAVYDHLVTLSPSFYEKTKTGEILSRLTTDTTLIQSIVGASASVALRNLFMMIGAIILLIYTSPRLSAYFVVLAPMVILPLLVVGRRVRGQSNLAQEKIADTSALAGESLGAIQTVQSNTQENREAKRFFSAVEFAFNAGKRRIRSQAMLTATVIFLVFASIVGVLWAGARLVANDPNFTGGDLAQFILYAIFAAASLGSLSEVWSELQKAAGAAERLVELLNIDSDIEAPLSPKALPGKVEGALKFEQVVFKYPTRDHVEVLQDFTLEVKPGEKIALVGPSGAGKTTVFQLLLRFYDPQRGGIELEGIDVRDLDPMDLRSQFAVVSQDPVIFGTTAMENILYGRPDATMKDVEAAAKVATADRFLEDLPEGYDTDLGPNGVTLSGGQRQRVAIARAVLRDAPILLLDEATSALDSESEQLVQGALDRLMENRTTLVIAHRLSTILKADRIVVMDQGRIVDIGRHEELVEKGGLYARLAELQFNANVTDIRSHQAGD